MHADLSGIGKVHETVSTQRNILPLLLRLPLLLLLLYLFFNTQLIANGNGIRQACGNDKWNWNCVFTCVTAPVCPSKVALCSQGNAEEMLHEITRVWLPVRPWSESGHSPVTVGSHPSHNRNQIGSRSSHGFRRSQTDHGQIFNNIILSTLCHIYSEATHACEFEQECQGQSITAEEKQFEFVNAEKTCWMHSAVREMRRKRVPRNHSRLDHGQIMIRIGSRLSPVTVGSHPGHNQNRNRVTVESRLSQVTDGSRVGSRSDPQQHCTIDSSRSLRS